MLAALRSTLFIAWMAVTVVPYALAVLLASIFIRGDTLYWICVAWLRVVIWGARVICGVRHRVQGMERLPSADPLAPVILAPKHQSAWETFALPTLMAHPLAYVFKRELLLIPFFGWAIGRLDMIHIDRSRRNEAWSKVAAQGKALLARGHWVIMFPEGTRTPRGAQGSYKSGATRLGRGHRCAGGADRGDIGALLAAQESVAAAGGDRHLDRRTDSLARPSVR